ncbi:hypothetical protein EWI31_21765 [Streptomyces tsukubensis]|uniref:Uncharacterized protein n=1 Tax=Streptomyces tsukubensis (strain DSM 42081 / NBRC 108919 / NRRL 18488 / 9993) TaxID=1114943 RepID=A0A7G3U6E5_STRT9|nr:hypothetical protein STSU_001025 [Streptomyces tsukubensis NRRL18488]TAI42233.1 hypothetical protein EWI31_21765 [Streptomyces tsukubensis]
MRAPGGGPAGRWCLGATARPGHRGGSGRCRHGHPGGAAVRPCRRKVPLWGDERRNCTASSGWIQGPLGGGPVENAGEGRTQGLNPGHDPDKRRARNPGLRVPVGTRTSFGRATRVPHG